MSSKGKGGRALTCEEAVKLFFAYLDEALKGQRLAELEDHLSECLDCCDRLDFTRQVDRFVGERVAAEPVPPELAARIRSLVAGKNAGG